MSGSRRTIQPGGAIETWTENMRVSSAPGRSRSDLTNQTPAPAPPAGLQRSRLRPKTPRETLEVIRRHWRKAPVDVYAAARELGLGPVDDPSLPEHVCGLIERVGADGWQIVVNRNHVLTRRRFAVAHAIGHFIYHRDKLEAADGVSDTLAFQTDAQLCPNPLIGPDDEWQANSFAINFLIPDHVLRTVQSIGITDDAELARGFNVLRSAMRCKLGLSPHLA